MKHVAHILQTSARIAGALALLAVSLFCIFGFLASFEPGNGLPWKLGYGMLGCASLTGIVLLLRPQLARKISAVKLLLGSAGLFFLAVALLWLAAVFRWL